MEQSKLVLHVLSLDIFPLFDCFCCCKNVKQMTEFITQPPSYLYRVAFQPHPPERCPL